MPEFAEPAEPIDVPKRKLRLSRRDGSGSMIILLALLAVAVGLLALDWFHGRLPRDRSYDLLSGALSPEEDELPKEKGTPPKHAISKTFEFWTTEKVHDLLNRTPYETNEKPATNKVDSIVTETYRFRGVFRNYFLFVVYDKRAHSASGAPKTTMTTIRTE